MRSVLAIVSLLAALALAACGGSDDKGGSTPTAKPHAVSESELADFAENKDTPVYWAGPRDGATYELTETGDGSVYIRYLVNDAPVGDPKPQYLTIGTYPQKDAFKKVQAAAKRRGARSTPLEGGGLAVVSPNAPQSAYFAFPDGQVAVEVFDPAAGVARRLVVTGGITPVD